MTRRGLSPVELINMERRTRMSSTVRDGCFVLVNRKQPYRRWMR